MTALFDGLRARLALPVLLTTLPALGLALYSNLEQRRLAGQSAQEEALRLVRLASSNQAALVEGARQLLMALAQVPQIANGDGDQCDSLLARIREENTRYSNLGVIGSDGYITCSAVTLVEPVYVGDRRYFQQAIARRDFATGDYQVGRVTGQASINFGYPISDEGGEPRAVVFAALDLLWLNELAVVTELGGAPSCLQSSAME